MATTHFGEKLKQDMKSDVNLLLGRIFKAHAPPLNDDQLQTMWNGTFPQRVQDAYRVLCEYSMPTSSLTHTRLDMLIRLNDKERIYFRMRDVDALIPSTAMCRRGEVWRNRHRHWYAPEIGVLAGACPVAEQADMLGTLFEQFTGWLRARAALETEFDEAFTTINEIIEMASTIGQLRRMMPDLATYLSPTHRNLLRAQQRASSLPHEFAAFDHGKLHRAVGVMAKCHLLPEGCAWSDRDNYTGAEFAPAD
jgi:hypothetical protein